MSKNITKLPAKSGPTQWATLLEEMKEEYWSSEELTDEQKRFLDELENLPEEKWRPIACPGKPASDAVIEERDAQ